ncbi:MAG TPA: efflux RND transporter periplasmic adaptor subunit, partial [Usitatibacter sp.]
MNAVPLSGTHRRRWPWIAGVVIVGAALVGGWWFGTSRNQEAKGAARAATNLVVTTRAQSKDVPVRLKANGTVTALQTVDLRAQVTSTIRDVHIVEGQTVAKGDLLFSLDSRADDANIRKAEAQVEKDKADLATAQRNLVRNKDLFNQKFISQAALDVAQNSSDTLTAQLAVDTAALESARVARAYDEIRAPFAGRTGTIGVRAGSLVQPGSGVTPGAVLVTVTQIDPIAVAFTLPEKELPGLQSALRAGDVSATITSQPGGEPLRGKVTFVDNAVDSSTGTIRVKAEFSNPKARLWPGAYVNVELSPRTIPNAVVIPAQAVQTGPDNRFVYVVGDDNKVVLRPVTLAYLDEGFAVVDGL